MFYEKTFYKTACPTITFELSQEWSSYKTLTVKISFSSKNSYVPELILNYVSFKASSKHLRGNRYQKMKD